MLVNKIVQMRVVIKMKPLVYNYTDTSQFLNDFKEYLSSTGISKVTYSYLGEKLGMGTRTKVKKYFKGEVPLSKTVFDHLKADYKYSEEDIDYLNLLKKFEHSKDPKLCLKIYKKLIDIRESKQPNFSSRKMDETELSLLDKWHHIVILYFFDINQKKASADVIARAFKGQLNNDEIDESLSLLSDLKLIKKIDQIQYQKTTAGLDLLDNLPRPIVKKFHSMMIERSLKAVYGIPFEKRYLMALTLPIKSEDRKLADKRIIEFISSMNKEFASSDADNLYQLNLQFFHLADQQSKDTDEIDDDSIVKNNTDNKDN